MSLRNGRTERRAGRQSRAVAIEVASRHGARKAGTVIAKRAAIPARQSGMSRPQRRAVRLEVGRIAAAHLVRNRRSRKVLTVGGIVLVALTYMSWKVLARTVRDLIAWDDARLARLENQPHRQRIAQAADGTTLEGTVIPPRQPGAVSRQRNAAWLGVGLSAATRVLRTRRFDEQVVVAIFAAAALSQTGWKELVGAFRDLIAWDNTRLADPNRQLRREREAKAGQLTAVVAGQPRRAKTAA